MEGERIIKTLKNISTSSSVDLVKPCSEVKSYLSALEPENAAKYELFCVKCLKSCLDVLTNSQRVPNGYKDMINCLVECLSKCTGSNNKVPQLSAEKVLLHIAKEYSSKKCYSEQLAVIHVLQSLLLLHKSNSNATSLHKNIADLVWRACADLARSKNTNLCLQLRLAAISSMFSAGYDEAVVMETIVKCTSKLSGSRDLISFYGDLEQILPQGLGVGNRALFLSRYCRACYNSGDDGRAEDCLEQLSSLTVEDSNTLDGLVLLIRTCHTITSTNITDHGATSTVTDSTATTITNVAAKLSHIKQSHLLPVVVDVMDWLNELMVDQVLPIMLISALHHLESVYLCCTSDSRKKLDIYKLLLQLIFANLRLDGSDVSEQLRCAGEQVAPSDNSLAELALSLVKQAQQDCGRESGDHCCLGNLAFNIGLALSRGHMYLEACPLLDVACKELGQWCEGQGQYIQKAQLASKYHLLYNCQRKAGYYDDALDTLALEAGCIPDLVTSDLISCWVKTCINTTYRSIVDSLQRQQPFLPDDVITTLMEAELKEARKSGGVEVWHGALTRLAKWYQDKGCGLQQARLLVEEAEWSLLQGDEAIQLCHKALKVLDSCHSSSEEWIYCNGLVHLWMSVCYYAGGIKSSDSNDSSCDFNDGSCDLALEAMLKGLNKWDGIAMEISQIDHHYSYKLLSTLLELTSLLLEPVIQLRIINFMINLTAGNHGDWMREAHVLCLHQQCDILSGLNLTTTLPWWEHDCLTHPSSCEHTSILLLRCRYHMIQGDISKSHELLGDVIQRLHPKDYYTLSDAKLTCALLLRCSERDVMSSLRLVDHMRSDIRTSPAPHKSTSTELLVEAVLLLRMLSRESSLSIDELCGWSLIKKLLECLYHLILTLYWHGNCRLAMHYCKEADALCVQFNLSYWRCRFLHLMVKIDLLRGQVIPAVNMETIGNILGHSIKGNSLTCIHDNQQCWKTHTNPHYISLLCHMIHDHTSLPDTEEVVPLISLANQIVDSGVVTCSKSLYRIAGLSKTDLRNFFEWVGLVSYTLHCTHLTDAGDALDAVDLATPTFPARCWCAEVAILWAELCLARGVALAETVLDVKTYLKTCWSYRSNKRLHRACITTARKRSHDVLADSSPEQFPRVTRTEKWPEENPHDDIIFRSDQSGATCRTRQATKGRKKPTKSSTKSSKQPEATKPIRKTTKQSKLVTKQQQEKPLPQQQPHPPMCADVVWPVVETLLQCYLFCYPVCPSVLVREVCLWLATCIGHHDDKLAAYFIHCSHGNSLHHQMVDLYGRQIQSAMCCENSYKLADTVRHHVTQEQQQQYQPHPHLTARAALQWGKGTLPPTMADFDWLLSQVPGYPLVSLNISPYQSPTHLVLCRIEGNTPPLLHCVASCTSSLDQFDNILKSAKTAAKAKEKSTFWRKRRQLDCDMKDLTASVDRLWLGVWRLLLQGYQVDEKALQDASDEILQLINSANGNCCGSGWLKLLVDSIDHLTNNEVDELLTTVTMETVSLDHMRQIQQTTRHINSIITSDSTRSPVTLLLGKMLHQFPWEQLPSLQIQPITRMPSLPSVIAHYILLGGRDQVTVDTASCYYMLNPSGNLGNTEKTFSKWFSSEPGWCGVVGNSGSHDHVTNVKDHQLFIYCGHGAGQEYLHGDVVQKLPRAATSLLIGCSSGQLVELGQSDPSGAVLNYLIAASPAVIANLWDVTDADTDRFCHALLSSWLHDEDTSLVTMVTPSREHCKLPYLVGGAAVMYGFPAIMNSRSHDC